MVLSEDANVDSEFCEHTLKHKSSFIVVVLKSLRHHGCVKCKAPIKTLEESIQHWQDHLLKTAKLYDKQLRLNF
jgi:hypothetical protein